MFNWAKQTLANVVGTEEPIYGPSALRSVAEEAKTTPYTELTRSEMKWECLNQTNVETQTFYIFAESGHMALVQVIYSNVVGIKTTCQFNSKIFYPEAENKPHLWCSSPLSDADFSDDKSSFYAKDCAVELAEDGKSYSIKSMNDQRSIVNLRINQTAPPFVVGKDGKTLYGTDLSHPWGSMRHAFWPRCVAEGTITTPEGSIDLKGQAFFSHALQGMKPHHAAAKWDFVNYQSAKYSAIMMEFTTPPSYGASVVNVGGIAKDGEIITANASGSVTHLKTKQDDENEWPEPTDTKYVWTGVNKDGKAVEAVIEGSLEERTDKVDVMAEVPGFVKKIVAGTVGTKPYIYQFLPRKTAVTLKLKIGDEEIVDEGRLFTEATFISGTEAPEGSA